MENGNDKPYFCFVKIILFDKNKLIENILTNVNIMYICVIFVILRSKEVNKAKTGFIAIFCKGGAGYIEKICTSTAHFEIKN